MYINLEVRGSIFQVETSLEVIIRQICSYLRHKHKFLILSRLSDLVTCSAHFNMRGPYLSFKKLKEDLIHMLRRHSTHKVEGLGLCDFVTV